MGLPFFEEREIKLGFCIMNETTKNGETFTVSHGGVSLPFELYSIEHIENELENDKSYFGDGDIIKIENATIAKIKNYYKENKECLGEHARYFTYIKFFNINKKENYGLVAGKTNYSNPDLLFDDWKDEKDHRYARIFLRDMKDTGDATWSETIIIINHKSSASEEEDKQAALFIECYLQRKFNLFNS